MTNHSANQALGRAGLERLDGGIGDGGAGGLGEGERDGKGIGSVRFGEFGEA